MFSFLQRQYFPLNRIEISEKNLRHNYNFLKNNLNIQIAPVLKSNAYGHGIENIAKLFDSWNSDEIPFFCVDSLYEAYEFKKAGIKKPILVMGYVDPRNLQMKKLHFSFAVWNLETVEVLNKYQKGAKVHLFVDTGMHREGIGMEELEHFLMELKKFREIRIEGLMSHLADVHNKKLTESQVKNFELIKQMISAAGFTILYSHIVASGGVALLDNKKNDFYDVARVGNALYGIDADNTCGGLLRPVLQLKSVIGQIKNVQKGESIGYDSSFIAKKDMQIAILPIGYFDGVDRRLGNKGWVKIGNIFCQIVGKVSMNITTVDISNIEKPFVGLEVIVYSNNPDDKNSIVSAAKICHVDPRELLVHLSPTTRRVINSS